MKEETGNPYTKNGRSWEGNAGLDPKIGVSSNFTVDLTVNPDFGQVESDPSVMNLTAFETFYEEKRPFFLEGLTIFDYKFDNQTLFYSRRIGHSPSLTIASDDEHLVKSPDMTTILSAAKFSGTTSNGLSVGLIQSVTANEFARITDLQGKETKQKVEPLTNYTVARIQKGYNSGNTVIGGMLTSTNRFFNDADLQFLSKDALTGGFDLLHHWKDKEFYISAKIMGSSIKGSTTAITALQESSARYYQRPGASYLNFDTTRTRLNGFGGRFEIGKGSKGFWKYSTSLSILSPGLELNDLGYMKVSDDIVQTNNISYLITKPVSIFKTLSVSFVQSNEWNFNSTFLGSSGLVSFTSMFKNLWNLTAQTTYYTRAWDTRILRGGYDMMMPSRFQFLGLLSSDPSKKVIASIESIYGSRAGNSAADYVIMPGISVRPFSLLKIGITADYENNHDELQYITTKDLLTAGKRYILGTIDQKTLGLTFRVDLNLTPEFSIQYYGSPFISKGTYSDLKHITNPGAKAFEGRFEVYQNPVLSNGIYELSDIDGGTAEYYSIDNPDFNFYQFRSNLVAKWEYRLGSFIYLVWSTEKTGNNGSSEATFGDSYKMLRSVFPKNIFLIKLNYGFSL